MTPKETEKVYTAACRTRRLVPQDDEGRSWHRTLREFKLCDVEAAMEVWWASPARDKDGELKSKWLPAPGELKPLVIAAQAKREAKAREPQDIIVWQCEGEGKHRYQGFIARHATRVPAKCHCGAAMKQFLREPA